MHFQLFIIWNNCYFVISVILWSLLFFMHLLGFLSDLVILVVDFVVWDFRCSIDVKKLVGLGRRLFRYVLRFAVFPPFIKFSMIRQYAQNTLRFTRPITETFKVIISFSSFQVTVISSFRAYRDPYSFSCYSLSFRGFSSISVMSFVVRFHQVLICRKFS